MSQTTKEQWEDFLTSMCSQLGERMEEVVLTLEGWGIPPFLKGRQIRLRAKVNVCLVDSWRRIGGPAEARIGGYHSFIGGGSPEEPFRKWVTLPSFFAKAGKVTQVIVSDVQVVAHNLPHPFTPVFDIKLGTIKALDSEKGLLYIIAENLPMSMSLSPEAR